VERYLHSLNVFTAMYLIKQWIRLHGEVLSYPQGQLNVFTFLQLECLVFTLLLMEMPTEMWKGWDNPQIVEKYIQFLMHSILLQFNICNSNSSTCEGNILSLLACIIATKTLGSM
jgi:hypothetical protein